MLACVWRPNEVSAFLQNESVPTDLANKWNEIESIMYWKTHHQTSHCLALDL